MDFLLAEIERKKKQIDQNEVTSNKKYFRRGELVAKQAEDYRKRHMEKSRRYVDDNQESPKKRKSGSDLNEEEKPSLIPRDEVVKRLRERGEPVRLFGETDEEVCQRLRTSTELQGGQAMLSSPFGLREKKAAETEEQKRKAIQLDLKEVKAKKLKLTETFERMEQEATGLAKESEVKKDFRLLKKSNALREKAVTMTQEIQTLPDEQSRLSKELKNQRIEMLQPDVNKGLRNDFKAAMERVDQQYLDELIQQQDGETSSCTDIQVKDDGTTLEDIKEIAKGIGKGDTQHDQQVIHKYLQFLLQCWAMDLNDKSREEKRKLEGKIASATHSQTQGYLKPLFRKLKYKKTPPDILESLVVIVSSMLAGDYVKANDAYLQMAIGNAPWPIGVTMVGIHARTGREKIFSQHVAHVLNDETQRKYIQGLKRLMTYCQKKFPVDPSKSVEYKALA